MKAAFLLVFLLATGVRASDALLPRIEDKYLDLFEIRDRLAVARAKDAKAFPDGTTVTSARADFRKLHDEIQKELESLDQAALPADDRKALETMQHALLTNLSPRDDSERTETGQDVECPFDAAAVLKKTGLEGLQNATYGCYGREAGAIAFEGNKYARLTILEMMTRADDAARRKALFMAMVPMFRAVNGDDDALSPYRSMLPLSAAKWSKEGSPIEANLESLGIESAKLEGWLVAILEAWRELAPVEPVEPWDYDYVHGAAGRELAARVPLEELLAINSRAYADLGADVAKLNVQFDVKPRPGKTPVAFCDFGARPRLRNGAWTPGQPSIFATYETGGLGNLNELIHETGHAVHIAAIRTRPAYRDWPDSDALTEGLADMFSLEIYEPAWQRKYLGAEAPLRDSLRSKYSGIVFDVAWALFEWRMHREPNADPNAVWTGIAARYLGIKEHPEWSWWARRGQLVNSPGYMMNYALGAILVADIRARARELRGPLMDDRDYYEWLSERIYRFGLSRPSGEVVRDFLGRAPSADALVADLRRGYLKAGS